MKRFVVSILLLIICKFQSIAQEGWSKNDRNMIFEECKEILMEYQGIIKNERDDLCICFLSEITRQYTKKEMDTKIPIELERIKSATINKCSKQMGIELIKRDGKFVKDLISNIEKNMISLKGGTFSMGYLNQYGNFEGEESTKPNHKVTLSPFYIAKYEITQLEYITFLNDIAFLLTVGDTPETYGNVYYNGKVLIAGESEVGYGNGHFVIATEDTWQNCRASAISWHGAKLFCTWLSEKTGMPYHLPTEAQWEYAALGGDRYGYLKPFERKEIENDVCPKSEANGYAICEIKGDHEEWCEDIYDANYYSHSGESKDPENTEGDSESRVLRNSRVNIISRINKNAQKACSCQGFRVVRY